MRFQAASPDSATLVQLAPHEDARGAFVRLFCAEAFAGAGLPSRPVQTNLSKNIRHGTLRGLHFQEAPHGEAKLVQCLRGRIYDVAVDLRPASPTFRQWTACELAADGNVAFFIPEGFAHGFQTLQDDSWVLYHMFSPYVPGAAAGVRWDDPALAIDWPLPDPFMSDRDRAFPTVDAWLAAQSVSQGGGP